MRRRESRSDRELREMVQFMSPEEREEFFLGMLDGMGTSRDEVMMAYHLGEIVLYGYSLSEIDRFISQASGLSEDTLFLYYTMR